MNPYVLIGGVVGGIVLVIALVLGGVKIGAAMERAKWQEKEITEVTAANVKIQELSNRNRKQEQDHVAAIAALGDAYAKERDGLEARRRRDVAAARDGALRLLVNTPCANAGRSTPAEAGSAAAGGDEAARTELPRQVVEDLLDLANDADQVVLQLTACQRVIASDRAITPQGASP